MDILATAFAIWAGVVGMIGAAIVFELARLRKDIKDIAKQLNEYIVGMERRVATLEAHMVRIAPEFQMGLSR